MNSNNNASLLSVHIFYIPLSLSLHVYASTFQKRYTFLTFFWNFFFYNLCQNCKKKKMKLLKMNCALIICFNFLTSIPTWFNPYTIYQSFMFRYILFLFSAYMCKSSGRNFVWLVIDYMYRKKELHFITPCHMYNTLKLILQFQLIL